MLVLFSRSLGEAATAQVQGKLQGDQWKAVAGRLKEQNKVSTPGCCTLQVRV
jgi:hypothetical protein